MKKSILTIVFALVSMFMASIAFSAEESTTCNPKNCIDNSFVVPETGTTRIYIPLIPVSTTQIPIPLNENDKFSESVEVKTVRIHMTEGLYHFIGVNELNGKVSSFRAIALTKRSIDLYPGKWIITKE